MELTCPTAALPHRLAGVTSIDHLAVPRTMPVKNTVRIGMPGRLSDHDAYVLQTG